MIDTRRNGQCMCGAAKFSAVFADSFGACHCKMCQRWAAGMFMGVRATDVEYHEGADHVTTFKSSDWAERGFCKICGSSLFYQMETERGEGFISFALGALNNHEGLSFARQLFVDRKTADFCFSNRTEMKTEAELEKMYGPL